MDVPSSTRTIRGLLSNEKIKHKKRIHRLRLKHKEKQLENAQQYQTMSAKEWRKVVFSDEKEFNLNGPDDFQKYCYAKKFPEENYSTRHTERRISYDLSGRPSHLQENLDYNLSVAVKKLQIM